MRKKFPWWILCFPRSPKKNRSSWGGGLESRRGLRRWLEKWPRAMQQVRRRAPAEKCVTPLSRGLSGCDSVVFHRLYFVARAEKKSRSPSGTVRPRCLIFFSATRWWPSGAPWSRPCSEPSSQWFQRPDDPSQCFSSVNWASGGVHSLWMAVYLISPGLHCSWWSPPYFRSTFSD